MYQGQRELIVLLLQNKTIVTSVRFAVNNPSGSGTERGAGEAGRDQDRKEGWKKGGTQQRRELGRNLVACTHFIHCLPSPESAWGRPHGVETTV